jgi:hypothetical protein
VCIQFVCVHDVEVLQPKEAPAFDQQLVGKRLEVLWAYFDKNTKEKHMIWSSGRVVRVADGLTDNRSSRAKTNPARRRSALGMGCGPGV